MGNDGAKFLRFWIDLSNVTEEGNEAARFAGDVTRGAELRRIAGYGYYLDMYVDITGFRRRTNEA